MAFVVTIVDTISFGTEPGLKRVFGTAVNGAGDSGGVVQAASSGIRKIDRWGFTSTTAQQAPTVVKSYDPVTYDADILTITTQLDTDYDFWIEGRDSGA